MTKAGANVVEPEKPKRNAPRPLQSAITEYIGDIEKYKAPRTYAAGDAAAELRPAGGDCAGA